MSVLFDFIQKPDIDDPEMKRMAQAHNIQVEETLDSMDQLQTHQSSWIKLKRALFWFLKLKHLLKKLRAERQESNQPNAENREKCRNNFKGTDLIHEIWLKLKHVKYCQK